MRRALGAALAAVLLLAAVPAGAAIVPQRGIKGVRLTDTVAKVRSRLGAPDAVIFTRDPIIGRTRVYKYGLTHVRFGGAAKDATVVSSETTSRAERTSRGIGVGSTRAQVAARVPGVKCRVEFGLNHCYVGEFVAGRRVTDFRITSTGRVGRVVVGFVVD